MNEKKELQVLDVLTHSNDAVWSIVTTFEMVASFSPGTFNQPFKAAMN